MRINALYFKPEKLEGLCSLRKQVNECLSNEIPVILLKKKTTTLASLPQYKKARKPYQSIPQESSDDAILHGGTGPQLGEREHRRDTMCPRNA